MRILRLFKKWIKMLLGKSVFHTVQGKGRIYSTKEVRGYYNDLTCKVCDGTLLDDRGIPYNITVANVRAYFPITVFQYGLGLYDLYLLNSDDKKLYEFLSIADWAVEKQKEDGSWDCMGTLGNRIAKTQSSMCQAEGASVLIRAYVTTKDKKYLNASKMAIDLMLKSVDDGGATLYDGEDVVLEEYVTEKNLAVLNGWIFSIFGLYDFVLLNDEDKYKTVLKSTTVTLKKYMKRYDRGFWTDYDICGTIASPFYNNLHINLLNVLSELLEDDFFREKASLWVLYDRSKLNRWRAMKIKMIQKLSKNTLYDINTGLIK